MIFGFTGQQLPFFVVFNLKLDNIDDLYICMVDFPSPGCTIYWWIGRYYIQITIQDTHVKLNLTIDSNALFVFYALFVHLHGHRQSDKLSSWVGISYYIYTGCGHDVHNLRALSTNQHFEIPSQQ